MRSALQQRIFLALLVIALLCAVFIRQSRSESSTDAWLRYAPIESAATRRQSVDKVVMVGDSIVLKTAQEELIHGIREMVGVTLTSSDEPTPGSIVLGTFEELRKISPALSSPGTMKPDGFWITRAKVRGAAACLVITAANDRGVLYGVFSLLSEVARGANSKSANEFQQPYTPVRWVNQWDNLDGRIERGYGGRSIFFEDGKVRRDLTRAGQYARLLASVGINGCTINNVNAAPGVLEDKFLAQVRADCRRISPMGSATRLSSVDLSTPK